MKILKRIWDKIPLGYRAWVILALMLTVLGTLTGLYFYIDGKGYDRCTAEHKIAAIEQKDNARAKIIPSKQKYESIKHEIANVSGENPLAGPRTSLAIDRMP